MTRRPVDDEDELERRRIRRAIADVVPGQAITKETFEMLGYGTAGPRTRNLTDEPMGFKPRPRPETPTT